MSSDSPSAQGDLTRLQWKHVIGIVGGLGPYAHLEFERLLLKATAARLPRQPRDQDYPEWILASVSATPDRTEALLNGGASPVPGLERGLQRLCGNSETPGADFAVIACNTAHAFLDELRRRVDIPIMDIVSETLDAVVQQFGAKPRVGLLATTGTIRSSLYANAASRSKNDVQVISLLDCDPNGEALQEQLVMQPIYGRLQDGRRSGGGIKSGVTNGNVQNDPAGRLREAVQRLAGAGAQVVLTACTEIPLAIGRQAIDGTPLIDPMAIAAERAIEIALGERELPAGLNR